jgi:hypothetical protein
VEWGKGDRHGDVMQNLLMQLERQGLGNVLKIALERYKRDQKLGRSRAALSQADITALTHFLGKPPKLLDLSALDAALRQSRHNVGLPQVLEALNGTPIIGHKQTRDLFEAAYSKLLDTATDPEWLWLLHQKQAGAKRIRRALRHKRLVSLEPIGLALQVLRQRSERLPVLATQVAGHAHAFDADVLLGQILKDAISALHLEPPVKDGVSSGVLLANLHGFSCVQLPWREVQKLPIQHSDVWLLENPAVFEALLDAGFSQPLLCSSGQPSGALMSLLTRLNGKIFVATDFDVGGLRIAKRLKTRFPERFIAWHYDVAAYTVALEFSGGFALSKPLNSFREAFPDLVAALEKTRRGAHQEAILERFLNEF